MTASQKKKKSNALTTQIIRLPLLDLVFLASDNGLVEAGDLANAQILLALGPADELVDAAGVFVVAAVELLRGEVAMGPQGAAVLEGHADVDEGGLRAELVVLRRVQRGLPRDHGDVGARQLGQRVYRARRARVVALRAQDLQNRRAQERVVDLGRRGRSRLGLRGHRGWVGAS